MRPYVLSMCVFVWTYLWCLVFVWKWLFGSHGGKDGTGEKIALYVQPLIHCYFLSTIAMFDSGICLSVSLEIT